MAIRLHGFGHTAKPKLTTPEAKDVRSMDDNKSLAAWSNKYARIRWSAPVTIRTFISFRFPKCMTLFKSGRFFFIYLLRSFSIRLFPCRIFCSTTARFQCVCRCRTQFGAHIALNIYDVERSCSNRNVMKTYVTGCLFSIWFYIIQFPNREVCMVCVRKAGVWQWQLDQSQ